MADSKNDVDDTPHFTYIWTIENISPCKVNSPTFIVKEMEMTKWFLSISSGFGMFQFHFFRDKEDDGPEVIEMKFELSFLGIDGLTLYEIVNVEKFEKGDFSPDLIDLHEVFFRRREEYLPKDALTIRCRMWRTGTEIAKLDSCFARTLLRPCLHSFIWAIREFSTLQRNHVRKFLLKKNSNEEMTFNLFITENDGEEYVSISLQYSDHEWCIVKICLLDFDGKVVHSVEETTDFSEDFLFENFIEISRLMNDKVSLLPNDVMSLRCEIEMKADIIWSKIEHYRYLNSEICPIFASNEAQVLHLEGGDVSDVTSCSYSLSTDAGDIQGQDETSNVSTSFIEAMKSLQEEGTLSDVSLRTDSKSFPAHKCILSARSPVFKSMFSEEMQEKTSKCVDIPDVDEDTLGELLSYIYTDKVGELEWRLAIDLYRAADKYDLSNLMRRCATVLKSDLSVSSVCAILSVADVHQDTGLREAAQDFIMQQGTEFFATDTWRSFKVENSFLAFDILEQIYCNMKR